VTETEQKQQLSIAYVHAVAARAGFACERPTVDDDSVDLVLAAAGLVHHSAMVRSPRLEVQLKATGRDILRENYLAFPLPIKNYNELRESSLVPRLLVVLLLPVDPSQWLEQSEEQMISRHCAYWSSLHGQPVKDNTEAVTVHLPRANLLTVTNLRGLMERAARKEPL
jgi:hypothetical protein